MQALPQSEFRESSHQSVLDDLVALGHDLARQVHAAAGNDLTLEAATIAFDRIARTVRRTVLLSRRLGDAPARDRTAAARREIIRRVEDAITRTSNKDEDRPTLRAELQERLDAPELDDEIGTRPTPDIILDIIRDLGLAPGPWPRRTPAEIRILHANAGKRPPLPSGNGRGGAVQGSTGPRPWNNSGGEGSPPLQASQRSKAPSPVEKGSG